MLSTFENPFAGYGNIISARHFIGRKELISRIERRVLGSYSASLALVGMPRIGKSSLAYHTTIENFQTLKKERFLPIWLNLSTYQYAPKFFHALVTECVGEIKKHTDWFNADLHEAWNAYQQEQVEN